MKFFYLIFLLITINQNSLFAAIKQNFKVNMSDGVKLNTNVFFPDNNFDFPLPVILVRTTYNSDANASQYKNFIDNTTDLERYIVVIQDIRGTHLSEGTNRAFWDDGWGEKKDGYETIEWITKQQWCNGKVAMFGFSALAITQYLAAATNPKGLICCFPSVGCWNLYDFVYQGGQLRQTDVVFWLLANSEPSMLDTIKKYYNYSEIWDLTNCNTRIDSIKVPMMHIGGWYDIFSPDALKAFYQLQYNGVEGAKGNQKVIIGPWTHLTLGTQYSGDIVFPKNAVLSQEELALKWFNFHLKDYDNIEILNYPNLSLYKMGPDNIVGDWNKWLYFDEWPFGDTDTLVLYPNSSKKLSRQYQSDDSLSFVFNPESPVPTKGGNNLFSFILGAGPVDQSENMNRSDILVFETDFIEKPLDIFGNIFIKLYASSDRYDTDLTAMLVDVYPDGRKILITDGIIMARHKKGFTSEEFLEPFKPFEVAIDLNYTAYTIAPGHKLGLVISSSNFPKHSVNPNTKEPVHQSTSISKANNTVYFGENFPSALVIPIAKNGYLNVHKNKEENHYVNIYPNPCNDLVNIEFTLNDGSYIDLSIINSLGNEIAKLENNFYKTGYFKKSYNITKFNTGLYYIKIKSKNLNKVIKFIISK